MLLDPIALAWCSWLGLAIGLVGLLVSLVGLSLTFREAKRAKDAANRAGKEVERVIALVRSRTRLATLASAVPQIDLLLNRVERDALRTAQESLTALRRSLIEAHAGYRDRPTEDLKLFRLALAELDSVDKLIWSSVEEKAKKTQMATSLQTVRTTLMELEVTAKSEELT